MTGSTRPCGSTVISVRSRGDPAGDLDIIGQADAAVHGRVAALLHAARQSCPNGRGPAPWPSPTRSIGAKPCAASWARWSGRSRRARMPAWIAGWRVFTRPSSISGSPVTELTAAASIPAEASARRVPSVATSSTPHSRRPRANSTSPVLSWGPSRARRVMSGSPPGRGGSAPAAPRGGAVPRTRGSPPGGGAATPARGPGPGAGRRRRPRGPGPRPGGRSARRRSPRGRGGGRCTRSPSPPRRASASVDGVHPAAEGGEERGVEVEDRVGEGVEEAVGGRTRS